MPEANVLYSVTAAVVVGLVIWIAFVLRTAREPWARPGLPAPRTEDVPLEGEPSATAEPDAGVKPDADVKPDAGVKPDADAEVDAPRADAKAGDATD